MARWHLGLDASAIRDGTYADFHRGQQADLAVEFEAQAWETVVAGSVSAARVEACRYDLVARVVAVGDEWWVLDCGLLVGGRTPPPAGTEVGHWVTGRAELHVSPNPAQLQAAGAPPLTHTWFIERIHHRVEEDDLLADLGALSGFESLHGGPEEPGWEELAFTGAWTDDDGRAEYLLECLLVVDTAPGG